MEIEDNKENLNKDKSPPTFKSNTNNSTNNNNNITINIHLPIADRTESKLSLNSNRENLKSAQTQDKSQQTNYNELANSNKNNNKIKLDLPLIRTAAAASKMMPIIKEMASTTDVTILSSEFNKSSQASKLKRKTAPPLLNKDMKSAPSYFSGQPTTNGFLAMKVNPTVMSDFSYLNRNKLVNRRLTLRKQLSQSILKGISVLPDEYENMRPLADFALGNPNNLTKSDYELAKEMPNSNANDQCVLTPDSARLLDPNINDSEMIIQAAANSIENLPSIVSNNEDLLLKQAPIQRTIKSSSIVILEK